MIKLSVFAFALLFASALAYNSCYVDLPVDELPSHVVDPIPQLTASDIPEQWLWANVSGTSFLTLVRSQMSPQYCGACWAFATTSALADRIKIVRNAYWPDMDLAPQILLSCSQGANQGCTGGNPAVAHEYIYNYGIAHESCSNYQAAGWDTGVGCSQAILCKNCYMNRTCYLPETYPIYQIEEYGNVQGEEDMLNEIYQRGPIVCGIDVRGLESYTGGIINDTTGLNELNHAVSIVGYGVDNGTPYWHVRASWGTHYGEDGFFRIVRGSNNLGIETSCQWATMVDTWTQTTLNTTSGELLSSEANAASVFDPTDDEDFTTTNTSDISSDSSDVGCAQVDASEMGVCFSSSGKYPWENLNTSVVPTGWDWRNVSGVNYCSWTRNQHIAKYCGACWAFAATSALADRINIASNLTITDLALSVQALINCKAGGTCGGGSPGKVFEWALTHGIPEDSCQQYAFANPAEYTCSDVQLCQKCFPSSDGTPNCTAVPNYRKWMVSEHGSVVGVELMKKAIYSGGPIACGIDATDGFRAYTGGIYSEVVATPKVNHIISLVGWGVEDGTEYWILRNHAGNFWGENGFMRIVTGGNNLGVENYCTWATPIVNASDDSDLGTGDFVGGSGDLDSF